MNRRVVSTGAVTRRGQEKRADRDLLRNVLTEAHRPYRD